MNLSIFSREQLGELERKIQKILSSGEEVKKGIRREISDARRRELERVRAEVFVELRVDHDRATIDDLSRPILQGISRLGEVLETTVLDEVSRGIRKDLPTAEVARAIQSRIDVTENVSKTLARTANVGIANAKRIQDGRDAGLQFFQYGGSQSPEREFCKANVNRIFSLEEIRAMDNGQGLPVEFFCGGYNCRHFWIPVASKDESPVPVRPAEKVKKEKTKVVERTADGRPSYYAELTEGQKQAYDQFRSVLGTEIPEALLRDDFRDGLVLKDLPGSTSSQYGTKYITIDTQRHERGTENFRSVIAHESGHNAHESSGMIRTGSGYIKERISPVVVSEMKKHTSVIVNGAKTPEEKYAVRMQLRSRLSAMAKPSYFASKFAELEKRFPGKYTPEDVEEAVGCIADYFGSLTKNLVGWGHSNSYYSNITWRGAEFWAHCSENYYVGNIVFQDEFPELYKLSQATMKRFVEEMRKK